MDENGSTRSGNAVSPQIAEAYRHTRFDRSFIPLKGFNTERRTRQVPNAFPNRTLHIPKMQFSAPFDHSLSHFSTDAHYLDSITPITIDQSLPDDDKAFLALLNGHTRQAVSHYPFSKLEAAHNDIQAIFPNKVRGMTEAPLLNPTLLTVLNAAENQRALKKYIEDMLVHTLLPFWGIRHESTDANTDELDFSQGQFSIDNSQRCGERKTLITTIFVYHRLFIFS